MKDLVVVENIELVPFFTKGAKVDEILEAIALEAVSFVAGDLSVEKNRKSVKAMVTKITKSKTYMEAKGKELAAEYKAIPKAIDANRKRVKDTLNDLQELVRKPLTDWEDEQKEIEAAKLAVKEAADLAIQVANDQEMALLLDDKFNADAKAELERIEQERIAYEADLQAKAALEATRLAEEKAEAQRKQVEEDKQAAIRNEQRAILEKEQSEEREKQAVINAENAEKQRVIDLENSEKAKVIEAERAEARRIADIETARKLLILAQENEADQLAAEQKARDEDIENQRTVNQSVIAALLLTGLNEEQARKVTTAIIKGQIPNVKLTY